MKAKRGISLLCIAICCVVSIHFRYKRKAHVDSPSRVEPAFFRLSPVVVALTQQQKLNTSNLSSSPPCGKICSYEWDAKEDGKYYPLLYKSVNCPNMFHRMAHTPYKVILPPPRRPPPHLKNESFTIDGQCPLAFWYFNNAAKVRVLRPWNATKFRDLLARDKMANINSYGDRNVLKPALIKYKHITEGKHVAVVGTQIPWAEAMLLNLGAKSITTIEYRQLVIEDKRVTTTTPYRMAEEFLSGHTVPFDTVFSYSSLEHSGLGRYGDPISPYGDLEATAQVWCMVKPGGHFIVAVPVSKYRKDCFVFWNAYRLYGAVRLQHMTANWRVLDEFDARDRHPHVSQRIYVLQKVNKTFIN